MTIKTSISLRDDIYESGEKKADKLFGGNFSAYICYLISRDREDLPEVKKKNSKIANAIDSILDL